MSDLKRIGKVGRRLMRSLAERLGIEGVEQRAPISLDTSRLVPVVLAGGLYACNQPELHAFMDLTNHNLAANVGYAYALWGSPWDINAANEVAAPQKLLSYENKEHWVRSIRLALTYDVAGAAANDNDIMILQVEVRTIDGSPPDIAYVIEHRFRISSAITFYTFVFPSGNGQPNSAQALLEQQLPYGRWDGYVPPGYFCVVRLTREDGNFWPANTTVHGQVWVSEVPEGVITNGH